MSIKFFKLGLAFTHSCTSWVHASPSKSKALFIENLRFLGYSHVQAHASPVIIYTKLAAFPSSKIFQILDAFSTPLCHSAPIRPFGGVYPELTEALSAAGGADERSVEWVEGYLTHSLKLLPVLLRMFLTKPQIMPFRRKHLFQTTPLMLLVHLI